MISHNPHICRRLVAAKLFIDEHFADILPIDIMAKQAFLSKFHFLRLFTKSYGLTPHQYVTTLRLRKARDLMRNGATVTDAMAGAGFISISSFNKLFLRHVKIVPSVYRRQIIKRRQEMAREPLDYIPDCFAEYMGWKK